MRNTFESLWKQAKTMTRVVLLSSFLSACGWGGWWGDSWWNSSTPSATGGTSSTTPASSSWKSTFSVQAGTVVWADVTIQTLDGETLISWLTTDNQWQIEIQDSVLNAVIREKNLPSDPQLKIVATWGMDIDPDDDGNPNNDIDIRMDGTMSALVEADEIHQARVTPVSTFVNDMIFGAQNENIQQFKDANGNIDRTLVQNAMQQIIDNADLVDTDGDGEVTPRDIQRYNMVMHKNSTLVQEIIHNGYLDWIHSGNTMGQNNFLDEKKRDINLVSLESSSSNGITMIQLTSQQTYSTTYYSLDGESWSVYTNEVGLEPGQTLYYREQYKNGDYGAISQYQASIEELEFIKKIPLDYNPTALQNVSQLESEVTLLQNELSDLQTSIDEKDDDRLKVEEKITKLESDIESLNVQLNTSFSSLDSTGKILADAAYAKNQKRAAIENRLVSSPAVSSKSSIQSSTKTSTPNISSSSLEDWRVVLQEKISDLHTEIQPLRVQRDIKQLEYNTKYQEYLDAKQEYDQDRANYNYWNTTYQSLKTEVSALQNDVNLYRNKRDLSSDQVAILSGQFNSLSYSVSSYKNSSYINKTSSVSKLNFSHRWESIKWYFTFSSQWGFPWKLAIHINGSQSGSLYTINSSQHLDAADDIFKNIISYQLDYVYYRDLFNDTNKDLLEKTDQKKNAYVHTFLYGLVALASQDIYREEEIAKDQALVTYNTAQANLQPKLDILEGYQSQLTQLWGGLDSLLASTQQQWLQLAIMDQIDDEMIALSSQRAVVNGQVQAFDKEITWEFIQFDDKLWKASEIYSYDSDDFPLSNERANIPEWYINERKNDINYATYPFTIYGKFNRVWNGDTYPALIWIEYKENPWSDVVYTTSRIEANNNDHVLDIIEFFERQVKERIDILRTLNTVNNDRQLTMPQSYIDAILNLDIDNNEKALELIVQYINYYDSYFASRTWKYIDIPSDNFNFASIINNPDKINFKANPIILDITDLIDPIACENDPTQCWQQITYNDKNIYLADLWNIVTGYLGNKYGYELDTVNDSTMAVSILHEIFYWRTIKPEWAIENEAADRPYYKAGYELAEKINTWSLTVNDLVHTFHTILPDGR